MKQKLINFKKRNWVPLLSAAIVLVFFLIVMIAGGVAPFGDYSFTFVDSMHQYLPFFSDYQGKLQNGGSMFYTWNIGLGQNFQSLLLYYMGCPLNVFVGLGTRKGIIGFMSMMIVLKLAFSAWSFGYLLTRRNGKVRNRALMVPFAVAYAIGNFMLGYMWNIMWLDCIMVMPLIILGIERIVSGGGVKLYTLTLFYALFVNYYISFIMCIFFVLWYLTAHHEKVSGFFINGLKFAGCSLLAGGMAAFSLLTAYSAIMRTSSASQTVPKWEWYGNIFVILKQHLAFLPPIKNDNFDGNANLYCGIFALLFLFLYIFSDRIRLADKIRKGILVAILIVSLNATTLNFIWHGFHDQYGIPNRFAFVYIFTILVMGYDAAARLRNLKSRYVYISLGCCIAFMVTVIMKTDLGAGKLPALAVGLISLGLVMIYTVLTLLRIEKIMPAKTANIVIMSVCIVELLANAVYGFTEMGFADGEFYLKYCEEMQQLTDDVAKYESMNGDTFYREEIVNPVMLDETTFDNMKGVSTFCSTVRGDTVDVMSSMGFYTGVNEYLYNGANPYTNAILGVKYVYDHDEAYYPDIGYSDYVTERGVTKAYRNKYTLPVGFAVDEYVTAWMMEGEGDADKLNSFVKLATNVDEIFEKTMVDMEVSGDGCNASVGNNSRYISYTDGKGSKISIDTKFTIPKDGIYYVEVSGNYMEKVTYYLNGAERASGRYFQQIFCLGDLLAGDEVKLDIDFSSGYSKDGQIGIKLAKWNDENFKKAFDEHNKEVLNVTDFGDDYIKGNITVSEQRMLFTSIPFDEGWTVFVDGEKAEIEKIGNAFIGVQLTPGTHEISMKFFPDGMISGIIISFTSWILFLLVICFLPFMLSRVKKMPVSEPVKETENDASDEGVSLDRE